MSENDCTVVKVGSLTTLTLLPSHTLHTNRSPFFPPPIAVHYNDADVSVHDEEWAECFIDKVGNGGRSRSGSHCVSQRQLSGSTNEDNATPPLTEKIKNSSSHGSITGLLAYL